MKKLVFTKATQEQLATRNFIPDQALFMSLYNIYISNEEKLTTRPDIRASAKLIDAFEDMMVVREREIQTGDKKDIIREFVMKDFPENDIHEMLLEDLQFTLLFGAVKKYQPVVQMSKLFDKIHEFMEEVEKQK